LQAIERARFHTALGENLWRLAGLSFRRDSVVPQVRLVLELDGDLGTRARILAMRSFRLEQTLDDGLYVIAVIADLIECGFDFLTPRSRRLAVAAATASGREQLVGDGEAARVRFTFFALAQQRQCQHVGPGLLEQGAHELGRFRVSDAAGD